MGVDRRLGPCRCDSHHAGANIEIRASSTQIPGEVIFLPLNQEEFRFRIEAAKRRHARLAKRLHYLRSPLNAIQGYAEMIAETVDGDTLRFASNICTASNLLTDRLTAIRDEGV